MPHFSWIELLLPGLIAIVAGIAWSAMSVWWNLPVNLAGLVAIMAAVVLAGIATYRLAPATGAKRR
jgi:hypothetical protein